MYRVLNIAGFAMALVRAASAGFNPGSSSNIAVYWGNISDFYVPANTFPKADRIFQYVGQNSYNQGSGPYAQQNLASYCSSMFSGIGRWCISYQKLWLTGSITMHLDTEINVSNRLSTSRITLTDSPRSFPLHSWTALLQQSQTSPTLETTAPPSVTILTSWTVPRLRRLIQAAIMSIILSDRFLGMI